MATDTVTPTLASEVKKIAPGDFRENRIDPRAIYGFLDAINTALESGEPLSLTDHPEFPNPRNEIDHELVAEIKEAGEFLSPIVVYFNKNAEVIVVDGKTRLIAAAEHLIENPDSPQFRTIPYVRVKGDETAIKMLMVKYNLDEARRPLTEGEVARAIERFTGYGLTDEDITTFFNKTGRGGTTWLNRYRMALNANPVVADALKAGEIDVITADNIARRIEPEDQPEAVEQAKDLIDQGVEPRAVRQQVGAKKTSNTTLGVKSTLEWLFDYYTDYQKIIKASHEKSRVSLEDEPETYVDEEMVITTVEALFRFLRKDRLTRLERMAWVESIMDDNTKAVLIDWTLPEDSPFNTV